MDANLNHISNLVNHLLNQRSEAEMETVLRELLTETELVEVANRLQIFEMLERGIPQRKIAERLGVGIATVTRGSKAYKKRLGQ